MANTTVYPFGTGGSLPASIGIVDRFTGGADKALSARDGKDINEQLNTFSEQDISSLTEIKAFIATNTGQWSTGYDNWKCKFLPVNPGEVYLIQANENRGSYIAILENEIHTSGTTPSYATGCALVQMAKGTYYQVTIPADGAYMYIGVLSNNNDCTPSAISKVKTQFSIQDEKFDTINSQRIPTESITVNTGWIISSTNKWSNQGTPSSNYACIMIPITPGKKYILIGNKTGGFYALLAANTKSYGSTPVWCADYQSRMRLQAGGVFEFTAPVDAAYLYLTTRSSGDDYDHYLAIPKTVDEQFQELGGSPSGASEIELDSVTNIANAIGNKLYSLNPVLDENGYVLPETLQELNVQKKAEQFAGLKWTPISAVPKNTSSTATNKTFPANTQVTGLPYSSVKELDKYVGKDVSIHTFMTAVNNPYSLLYTENVSGNHSASAWGKTYHGVNCASYYGQVCSQFVAACQGGAIDYATETYPWVDKKWHGVVKVFDQSAQGAMVGDLFWKSGHCRLIYAVKKNASGEVTDIRIAESTYTNSIINNAITATAFNNEIKNDGCIIYRPLWLYRNIDYVPSPYVAVRDETPQTVTYNDDICTFAGDKACFREGDTVAINYNLKSVGAWTAMELYKGTTLLDTITIDASEHIVDLTSRNLTYGKYKARMTDGMNYSDYTEWEILQADVTFVNNGDITTITPVSANGKAVAVKVCVQSGSTSAMRELTEDEQNAASFDIDFVSLNASQMPNDGIVGVSGLYLKVYFQGEFGRVTNFPASITFGY